MKQVAKILLEIRAIKISKKDFTWSSGIKSPIYTDNRIISSYPKVRKLIQNSLVNSIKNNFPQVESLMGVATGGITHAAYASMLLDLPMGYVRAKSKEHGKKNTIEGKITKNQKVVVIEDLFSTGNSTMHTINTLINAGFDVLGTIAIFSYDLNKFKKNFENIKYYSLTNLDELLEVAFAEKYITQDEIIKVKDFREKLQKI